MKYRICMVAPEYPPKAAGVGYYVRNLSKKLVERGYEVTVLTRGSMFSWSFENDEGIPVVRAPFIPLPPLHIQIHGFFLNKFFQEEAFDLIHYHSPLVPKIKSNKYKVVTFHSCWKKEAETYDKTTDLYSLYVGLFKKMFARAEQQIIDDSTILTAVGGTLSEELEEYYKTTGKKIRVVGNAVNTDKFFPGMEKGRDGSVLYSGRIVYRKGVLDLLDAAEYVLKRRPQTKFIFTGGGTLLTRLKKEAKKKGLEKNIVFTGPITQDKLISYYQTSSVYVLPAHYEGLPTTLLEAMACEMPVVATDIASISAVVSKDDVGLRVPPKKPDELGAAILKLLVDEELRKRLGENGRKLVEENYAWEKVADRIIEAYDELGGVK